MGLRPVSYLPLQRYVEGTDPIHISNSLAVHGQGVYIGTCFHDSVRPSFSFLRLSPTAQGAWGSDPSAVIHTPFLVFEEAETG